MEERITETEKKLFLSFIVPVYNVENYLRDCLDSLLTQNVEQGEYEIICVNDGSTDGSLAILREYEKEYKNVRVIDKENGGASSARNVGLKEACGEYVWFVDSDDFIKTNCLSSLKETLSLHKPNILKFEMEQTPETYKLQRNVGETIIDVQNRSDLNLNYIWNILLKLSELRQYGIFYREDISYAEDLTFTYYVYLHLLNDECLQTDTVLYYYRQREGSLMHGKSIEQKTKRVLGLMELVKVYKKSYDEGIDDKIKKDRTKRLQNMYTAEVLYMLPYTSLSYKEVLKDLKENKLYPYPILWWHIKEAKGKPLAWIKSFLKFRCLYKIYYSIAKKKGS